jgi:flagellar L-ring protein precursor FlgH
MLNPGTQSAIETVALSPSSRASLWTGARGSLLGDRRAMLRGDIMTVVIEIDDRAEISNSSDRSRSASQQAGLPQLLGIPQRLDKVLPTGATSSSLVDLSSQSASSGDGTVRRNEKLELRVAVTITDVLPNGVLAIFGRQEVRVNFELRELLVTGYVRPEDIMMQLLLPVLLTLIGVGGGVGAGLFLKPAHEEDPLAEGHPCGDPAEATEDHSPTPAAVIPEEREYAKLNNQFVIPVVEDGAVAALVVMSLNLEVVPGSRAAVFAMEPKLRGSFLQVMFDHANIGGFSGNFTSGTNMRALRNELLRSAGEIAADTVTDVLIIDIIRQDS